jgi:hypothetical protein
MVHVESRSTWSNRTPEGLRARRPGEYEGVGVHWPGIVGKLGLTTHAKCRAFLRRIENEQMDRPPPKNYAAIAYQVASCPHGRLMEGRGRLALNGANGDLEANTRWGSVLVMVGTDDTPTPAQLAAVLEVPAWMNAKAALLPHRAIRPEPTACPGPFLIKWIAGNPTKPRPEDNKMTLTPADLDAMRKIVREEVGPAVLAARIDNELTDVEGDTTNLGTTFKTLRRESHQTVQQTAPPKA